MTTESLSPVSRIVIETSSRPPGERSTSISLTGGAEGAEPGPSAVARGATSASVAPAIEASGPNAAPATNAPGGCAPNEPVCAVDGAAKAIGSGGRPSVPLPLALHSAGGGGEGEVGTQA